MTHNPPNYDHTIPPEPFPSYPPATQAPHKPPAQKGHNPHKPDDYMAVIPYGDVYKLFEMLNKHTKPYDDKKMQKKIRKSRPTPAPLPPPTTKRTEILQPKVVKRTRLKGRKKKKKTVHVSLLYLNKSK